jgi:hypothetical protein
MPIERRDFSMLAVSNIGVQNRRKNKKTANDDNTLRHEHIVPNKPEYNGIANYN